MSWLSVTILVLWLLIALNGFRRGLIRTAISMVFLILAFVLTAAMSPGINKVLVERSSLHDTVAARCEKSLQEKWSGDGENVEIPQQLIESLPLPESVKSLIKENSGIIGSVLGADTICKYVGDYMATLIVYGIAILISLILSIILILIVVHLLNKLANLPVLGGINRVGGLLLGLVQGLLWIWIFFLIVTVLANTPWGTDMLQEIHKDNIMTYLYDNNLIMDCVMNMIKGTSI